MEGSVTHGGLFSGIGGFSRGFELAGIKSLWEVEIDPKCKQVIRKQFPPTKIHGDIKTFNADEFECPDIISFGFPCTDVSIAGKRAGVIDGQTRSGLFYEACRIIKRFVPRGLQFAVAENVPGIFSADEGRAFAAILGTLGELGALDIAWVTLDSQWFGLAQRRERVFIVVDFRGQRAGQILSLSEGLCWNPAPLRTPWKDIASCLGGGSASGGFRSDTDRCGAFIDTVIPIQEPGRRENQHGLGVGAQQDPMFTLQATSRHGVCCFNNTRNEFHSEDSVAGPLRSAIGEAQRSMLISTHDPAPCLNELSGTCKPPGDALSTNQNASGRGTAKILSQYRVRRLTPNECAILSGFPPSWNSWLKDSPRYAQFGNCVNVPVAEWIGRRIVSTLKV